MSYLSLIHVGKSEAARLRLSDAYAWHQRLWETFPGQDGQPRNFLFRVEDRHDAFRIYLLSPGAPQTPDWGHWQTKAIAPSFLDHDRYCFHLRANPTMRRDTDHRRLGIFDESRLHSWFRRKAAEHGFEAPPQALTIGAPTEEIFVRSGRRGKHVAVDFAGVLMVRDRARFRDTYHHGIGSAKAFGFGLLLLAPVV